MIIESHDRLDALVLSVALRDLLWNLPAAPRHFHDAITDAGIRAFYLELAPYPARRR